jgi:hypothetical protein
MSVKLLFNNKPEPKRRAIKPPPVSRQSYDDIANIRILVCDAVTLTDDHLYPVRVKLVRDEPVRAYRVTVLKKFRGTRVVKRKDGTTVVLQPGIYVDASYFVESVSRGDFVFTPPLPEVTL